MTAYIPDIDAVDTDVRGIWRPLALRCGLFVLAATAIITAAAIRLATKDLPNIYLVEQDAFLLAIAGVALIGMAFVDPRGPRLRPLTARQAATVTAAAALVAWAGGHWLLGAYAVSRDEVLADFAAEHFRHGLIAQPVPAALRGLGQAAMPLWTDGWISRGYWVSAYLPVNSLFRALAASIGDPAATGPLLLIAGAAGIWSTARRLWPEQPEGATVALVLTLTSAQVLANAMTGYAMTGHFALNAVWIACVLRGGRLGHGSALGIGLLASGLHQVHFFLLFVAGFLPWLWLSRQRGLAVLHAAACVGYAAIWFVGWPWLLTLLLGVPDAAVQPDAGTRALGRLTRLFDVQPLPALARFIAWQNVLLVPLGILGLRGLRRSSGSPSILWGCAGAIAIGCAATVYQGHGYGYRYLHGLIPCIALICANGWLTRGLVLPARLLWASAAVAICLTAPFAIWRSEVFAAPYAAAHRAIRTAAADVVLVDPRAGAFVQDLVRWEGGRGPLVLDLGYVPEAALVNLCLKQRVALLAEPQARAFGIRPALYRMAHFPAAAARRAELDQMRCALPLPVR